MGRGGWGGQSLLGLDEHGGHMLELGESPGELGARLSSILNSFFPQVVWKWHIFSEVKIRGVLTSGIYSLKLTLGKQGI